MNTTTPSSRKLTKSTPTLLLIVAMAFVLGACDGKSGPVTTTALSDVTTYALLTNGTTWKIQRDGQDFDYIGERIVETSLQGDTVTLETESGASIPVAFHTPGGAQDFNDKLTKGGVAADLTLCAQVDMKTPVDETHLLEVEGKPVRRIDVKVACSSTEIVSTPALEKNAQTGKLSVRGELIVETALAEGKLTRNCVIGETMPAAECLKNQ